MRILLTRLEVEGFRSLRAVSLQPRPLQAVLDPGGAATRDLAAVLTLLRELAHGQLQEHLARPGVTEGWHSPVKLGLGVHHDDYRVELARAQDGVWRIVREGLDLYAGVGLSFVDPDRDSPRDEAFLSTFPPGPTPEFTAKTEEAWLGEICERCSRSMNAFLRGLRVAPAGDFTVGDASLLLLEEPDGDLPPNAAWDRGRSASAAASLVPVLLCTPSVALADALTPEDVLRGETVDGVCSFRPVVDTDRKGP